ncbi:MAG: hypothetical protein U0174_16240 [Polyangiaceae bacterium]
MIRRHIFSIATFSVATVFALVPGCTTLTVEGDDAGSGEVIDATVTKPDTGSTPAQDAAPDVKDAGKITDAKPDNAVTDSGKPDTGTPAPNPGDACMTPGAIFKRGCGLCGTQEAICEANKVVSAYGFCTGEVANGCTPGATRQAACGLCGSRQEICQNNCVWAAGGCQNEVANGCTPGTTKTTTAGCVVQGEVKVLTCQNTCMYDVGGACGPIPTATLGINGTVGQSSSLVVSLSPTSDTMKRYDFGGLDFTDTCPATLDAALTTYVWVKLTNPTAMTAKVSVWLSGAGGANIDTMLGWYNRANPPTDDAGRLACSGYINDDCGSEGPCDQGSGLWSGLIDFTSAGDVDARPTIPPNGAIILYVGAYSTATTGNLTVNTRTDILQ